MQAAARPCSRCGPQKATWNVIAIAPSGEHDGAQNRDEDQDGGHLKGQQQRGEERMRENLEILLTVPVR